MIKKYLIQIDEVKPLDVSLEEGFQGVDSRLLISDETVGSEKILLVSSDFSKRGVSWASLSY